METARTSRADAIPDEGRLLHISLYNQHESGYHTKTRRPADLQWQYPSSIWTSRTHRTSIDPTFHTHRPTRRTYRTSIICGSYTLVHIYRYTHCTCS